MNNKSLFRNLSLIIFCIVVKGSICFAQKNENVLSNKNYIVVVTEKNVSGKTETMNDVIQFKSGKVSSKFSNVNGFSVAIYVVTIDSSASSKMIIFTAQTTNPDKEIMKWTGTISGEAIEGKAICDHKGKSKHEYSFTGTLKK